MRLPESFEAEMKRLLGEEAERFFASYAEPKHTGLRLNGLKQPDAAHEGTYGLEEAQHHRWDAVPWAPGAYYTNEGDRPGKHPHYYTGMYYIQEPSAMVPAELLDVQPGHRVLDLCAAPGGKTTQLAAKLSGRGFLITNDNASERTKALAKNVERAGVRNAIVTNEEPSRLADKVGSLFDRVLVDAPCSGEGMFRKDEDMARLWEPNWPEKYAAMQDAIMRDAARMVVPGGKLVYSTCTFSPVENEGTIARFLAAHPDFSVVPVNTAASWGFAPGRPDWLTPGEAAGLDADRAASLAGTVRIWPHRVRGEGHFVALLVRAGKLREDAEGDSRDSDLADAPLLARSAPTERSSFASPSPHKRPGQAGGRPQGRDHQPAKGSRNAGQTAAAQPDVLGKFALFAAESLVHWETPGRLLVKGDYLYALPEELPELQGLKLVRPGWLLGIATKHRFEPSQALAMGLIASEATRSLMLRSEEDAALRYLKGETLHPEASRIVGPDGQAVTGRGWILVCIDGYPAGWGRWDGTLLKNELLPGWRWV